MLELLPISPRRAKATTGKRQKRQWQSRRPETANISKARFIEHWLDFINHPDHLARFNRQPVKSGISTSASSSSFSHQHCRLDIVVARFITACCVICRQTFGLAITSIIGLVVLLIISTKSNGLTRLYSRYFVGISLSSRWRYSSREV